MQNFIKTLCAGVALGLSACATTSAPIRNSIPIATPDPTPPIAQIPKTPPRTAVAPPLGAPAPSLIIPLYQSPLTALPHWAEADPRPALKAFQNSCLRWEKADPADFVDRYLPEYGTYRDWQPACELAKIMPVSGAKQFFEREFVPVRPRDQTGDGGLLTGYYQPEIMVRKIPTPEFSEPILSKPDTDAVRKLPRSALTAKSARVIAYGRPIDVFFMQVQGSGHMVFKDGRKIRAAYAANNGYDYASIGRVLIERGEVTKNQSSKGDIERWMKKAGPKKSRELMNQNKRYIFFAEQAITPGEGPVGAMQVPLSAMGSIAVDPRYHPYGTPAYLVVKLPQTPGDYRGTERGQLVIAQDTGKAIKGALRADLFFGSGDRAGQLAGVMKHKAQWMILLPRELVERETPIA